MNAAELLSAPADEGCRRIALGQLEALVAARGRLDDRDDREALHDFRVALRRLRSWIRAFDDELRGSVRPKYRRRLRAISRAAGAARDAEVHVAWLRDAEETLQAHEQLGGEWLLRRAVEQQRQANTSFYETVSDAFLPTAQALAEDLAVYTLRIDLRDPTPRRTFAQAAAPLIQADATALGERLAAVQSSQDQVLAHAARIAGKRLRYLLEPIADAADGAPVLVKRLRNLQDTIGEMHDVHVMSIEVIQAAETAGAEQARRVATALLESEKGDQEVRDQQARDPRLGLLAVAAQLRARGESAFAELQQRWLGDHSHDLSNEARQIAASIFDATASPSELEVVRDLEMETPVDKTRGEGDAPLDFSDDASPWAPAEAIERPASAAHPVAVVQPEVQGGSP
jgi:CHAD domain-containing protein